ncbi:probable E3 ubiquitin-protein ligase EDA40 [Mangifera indica]|uniref:probable E3 ubiquitin-protein ligase EDA40 n=1 Tax=Mangifera indica TaxID=29780 RepID=UPI001CF9C4D8|nr:probable E3 ubiquitin-protein ligase EDA40 [Mangifera indica]
MVTGWRRAFCTSIPKEKQTTVLTDKQHKEQKEQQHCNSQSPRLSSKFGFFSNPSTPKLHSQPVSSPGIRCKTTATTSVPNSPRLQCKTSTDSSANLSSPKSPSSFSFLKATLRLSKSRCGICFQRVKTGQGTAIFTAECSHTFHFPCITNQVNINNKSHLLICPVCNSHWKQLPLLTRQHHQPLHQPSKAFKVYNDDEPLTSSISLSHFNTILESSEEEESNQEFQGFFPTINTSTTAAAATSNVHIALLPEAAVVTVGRSYETCAMVLKVKAPPCAGARAIRRAPIDLVTVLDVSLSMGGSKLQMIKRFMRLVISNLSASDRLSIVAFSTTSKRLLPLRRMTTNGRRSARRIVDAIGTTTGQGITVSDALKKAAKVLEDRRERNPFSTILVLSTSNTSSDQGRSLPVVSSTRFSHSEIPVHTISFSDNGASNHALHDEAFSKFIGGLLSVVVQDLKLQLGFISGSGHTEITGVYSLTGRPASLGLGPVRVGDLYTEEERELLIELKVAGSAIGSQHVLSVRSSYKEPSSQEVIFSKEQPILAPTPQTVRSSTPSIVRLRNLHITSRAVAESRRLIEINDFCGAYHLLSSARALLMQKRTKWAEEYVCGLEAELAELHKRRQQQQVQGQRGRVNAQMAEEKPEPLTPTSAWRAAERLAKVAIMRKHLNRVSDLHGFENARF